MIDYKTNPLQTIATLYKNFFSAQNRPNFILSAHLKSPNQTIFCTYRRDYDRPIYNTFGIYPKKKNRIRIDSPK
ncbi:hypothetical protein LEP1GSC188_0709 [Leptospira weilii serovar Topaz str. LT2116]|uniref:Uncharacterized protein n=1 Tax=Leptospira weilii serovar Topaz str. LT2116 TaxID=1088540 RepID=M3GY88_9LEPT|nr:hypothetical protein LEP1GSC188_0709 [Leptospira weilii serovar Topaz str. LT2116]